MKERINDKAVVQEQYRDDSNLRTRISLHDKYSVNKQGFGNWIFAQYDIREGEKLLELGCGEGGMWRNHVRDLPNGATLTLSDFSEGMLAAARRNVPDSDCVTYRQIDIQDIPYEDDSFDIVIANMMLYHVPDIDRGLHEVRRVLKQGGAFYCATYGENGIAEYVQRLLGVGKQSTSGAFTLQNGESILKRHFDAVDMRAYKDHLEVTDAEDLVEYVLSMTDISHFGEVDRGELRRVLETKKDNGIIVVPKEYGIFISR